MKNRTNYNLTITQDHKDLEILGEELTKRRLRFRTCSKLINGKYRDFPVPQLRGSYAGERDKDGNYIAREGHYINFNYILSWGENEIGYLQQAIYAANERTKTYIFELHSTSDIEYDDDRIWDASFTFYTHTKEDSPI